MEIRIFIYLFIYLFIHCRFWGDNGDYAKRVRSTQETGFRWKFEYLFIYLFIYSFIVGFGVIMVIMQRGCGVHRKPVLEIAALQFFTFFIHLSRMGGLVVHGARECLFHRDREREEPPRRQGQGKGLSQVFKYLPFFSFMLVVHVCVHLLPCRFWVL